MDCVFTIVNSNAMDILQEINEQIKRIKKEDSSNYLDSIYNHLDRAEYYYKQGNKDQQYFNDVIYRANQAYEGALKEAYKVLANKTDSELQKTTPNLIEKHFKDNNVFKDRVLQLFQNYRQEWRNKSTHDYKLTFDESEAFLALVSVSSFVHLLLKQIQETIAFKNEQRKLLEEKEKLKELKKIIASKTVSLPEKLFSLIGQFSRNNEFLEHEGGTNEVQLMGMLHGFFTSATPDLIVRSEPAIKFHGIMLRPDFIFELGDEKVLMEVKKYLRKGALQTNINQVAAYLEATEIKVAILYFISRSSEDNQVKIDEHDLAIGDNHYKIYIVTT